MLDRDPLTGLFTRRALPAELERRIASGARFALLMMDMDQLKAVNGFNAHRRGDWLLRQAGQAIAALDPMAPGFRYGGDEFVVLLPTGDLREATRFAQRIVAAVSAIDLSASGEPDEPDDPDVWQLGCSVGIVRWPDEGAIADDLLDTADAVCFSAKARGGGGVASAADADVARWLARRRPRARRSPEDDLAAEADLARMHEEWSRRYEERSGKSST